MRISNQAPSKGTDKSSKSATVAVQGRAANLFTSKLTQQQQTYNNYDAEIAELGKQIEEAGDTLQEQPTLPNFKKFKELLRTLSKKVTSEALRLDKFGGTPQAPRYFETVTVIDEELERLYNLIICGQKDNMAITAKVIGIKGLIVDLMT